VCHGKKAEGLYTTAPGNLFSTKISRCMPAVTHTTTLSNQEKHSYHNTDKPRSYVIVGGEKLSEFPAVY